jgi:outer membrane lipoprotein-sorting protein
MRRIAATFALAVAGLIASAVAPAAAETPEEKGRAIAEEADRREDGYGDTMSDMLMILKNKHGDTSKRKMRTKELEVTKGDITGKGLIIFDNPRDVKGTALLTYSHKTGNDDQWLYLPALKRVKRISSSNKSGSFMGSEFSYEDLGSREPEKYDYKWIRDEKCPGESASVDCFVLEAYPKDKYSGYTRQVVWMDKHEYRPQKIEYYDRKKSLLKTLVLTKYKLYLDKYWRANELYMENHQSGKSTRLVYENYRFGNGFKDSNFTKTSLKRAR